MAAAALPRYYRILSRYCAILTRRSIIHFYTLSFPSLKFVHLGSDTLQSVWRFCQKNNNNERLWRSEDHLTGHNIRHHQTDGLRDNFKSHKKAWWRWHHLHNFHLIYKWLGHLGNSPESRWAGSCSVVVQCSLKCSVCRCDFKQCI